MGCASSGEDCYLPDIVPYCCDDLRCTKEPKSTGPHGFVYEYQHICREPSSESKVGERPSHTMREKAVGGGTCVGEIDSMNDRCQSLSKEDCESEGANALSDGVCDWIEDSAGDFNLLTCEDDDAGLVDFATRKGFSEVVGCSDATRFCSRDKVVDLCPATCAAQSGCDQLQKSLLVESVVESPSGAPEMAVFALAIVGGIAIVSRIFTACTSNKEEYKAVLEEKNSEEI